MRNARIGAGDDMRGLLRVALSLFSGSAAPAASRPAALPIDESADRTTLSLIELVGTALRSDTPYARRKFEDFRTFSATLAIFVSAGAAILWVADFASDPIGAHSTLALRALYPLLIVPYVAALLMRMPTGVAVACWFLALMAGQAIYTQILARLSGGMEAGISGYLYFLLVPLLTAGSQTLRVNLAGILVVGNWPLALSAAGYAPGLDWARFVATIWPAAGMAACAVCAFSYVHRKNYEFQHQLEIAATTDPLTGAANRRRFSEALSDAVLRSRRYRSALTLIMLDIDHFKRINDNWGHATGDLAIRRIVEVAHQIVREADLVGRLGGEEFAVLLPDTDMAAALVAAERLREAIEAGEMTAEDGTVFKFTSSFGVAEYRDSDVSGEMLLGRADAALYDAKHGGRNRVEQAR
jgi:diguanylate cyclase (GGDEF)-like protein